MPLSERVDWHLGAGRIPRAFQLMAAERMMHDLGMTERQFIRAYGLPPLDPNPEVVYLIGFSRRPEDGEAVKIGTTKNAARRIEELQAGAVQKLYLVAYVEGGRDLEREIHAEVEASRIREDWFEMGAAVREAFRVRIEELAKSKAAL